jgi:glyoxylase-like metal-dependent hydrolase (beta-lactamase superfamily II)
MKAVIIPVTPFQQNCTLLWCEQTGQGALVDPGGDLDRLQQTVQQHQVNLTCLLLTHAHIDHAGGAGELARLTGVPIIGPQREDRFWIDSLPGQSQMFGFPAAEAFEPDRWLEDGDQVEIGQEVLEVIHCPGHTPGHVVYFSRHNRLALVGDVLFQGSIGRTDFPRGDHGTLVRSIREKLWPLGDDVRFIPGHGPMSSFGQERKTNPFVADPQYG